MPSTVFNKFLAYLRLDGHSLAFGVQRMGVFTLDSPVVVGERERQNLNGLSIPTRLGLDFQNQGFRQIP